ncbi:hypothetical protein BDW69DRAFT_183451 [Aspergillus filifer]
MTSTSTYTYTSRAGATPAEPVLANSLLQPTSTSIQKEIPSGSSTANWDLTLDIEKDLFPPSEDDLFHPGKVIGFSQLRRRRNEMGDDDDELVGQLPRYLLTSWLSTQSNHPHTQPSKRAYIIHPQTSGIFSPQALLTSLLSNQQGQNTTSDARNHAISLLDSVTLFPVYDFASAVDALHDVSGRLSQEQAEDQQSPAENVLILVGLDTLTGSIVRSSNVLRGAAVLSSALRTITSLSRVYKESLSVLTVNTSGVGHTHFNTNQTQNQPRTQQHLGPGDDTTSAGGGGAAGIQSAFSMADTNLFPSLLMRTLDQGIDTHLLLSRGRGGNVVEVIKDRVGGGLGRWCIWPRKAGEVSS